MPDSQHRGPLRSCSEVTYLAPLYGLCLLCSALGFVRVVYFVGAGYALSMAAQAACLAVLYSASIAGWPLIQGLLLLAYGLRLGTYLTLRDQDRTYQARQATQGAQPASTAMATKLAIWVGVSALYVLMALPAALTLSAQASQSPLQSLPYGIVVMAFGLGLESAADWQKYRFKSRHPDRFCDTGLYRWVRCPNYLGEMLFWGGLWLSATSTYSGWLEWILCTIGLASILGIMIGATRRLEEQQAKHYGQDAAFASYRRRVPVLLPFVPLYSLRRHDPGHP